MAEYKEVGFNKKANFNYQILETLEAGIVLLGSEVKSLRYHRVNLTDSYAGLSRTNELFLYQMHIPEYALANRMNHKPNRTRKLLLHRKQLQRLIGQLKKGGYTLVPLKVYFNEKGYVKISLGIGRGKKNVDKRETIKQREWQRNKARIMKGEKF